MTQVCLEWKGKQHETGKSLSHIQLLISTSHKDGSSWVIQIETFHVNVTMIA